MPLWQVETAAKLQLLLKNRRKRSRTQVKVQGAVGDRKRYKHIQKTGKAEKICFSGFSIDFFHT